MQQRFLVLIAACLALAACATGTEYRKAEVIEPMKTPPEIAFEGEEPLYTVPELERRQPYDEKQDKFEAPEPPQLRAPIEKSELSEQKRDPDTRIEAERTRDGNGYPIIMMRTRFAWAWEAVGQALEKAGLRISDRDRDAGLYYLKLDEDLGVDKKKARVKLSQTANGIQVAVLRHDSQELLDKAPAKILLDRLHEQL